MNKRVECHFTEKKKQTVAKKVQTRDHGGLQWVQRVTMIGMQCVQCVFAM